MNKRKRRIGEENQRKYQRRKMAIMKKIGGNESISISKPSAAAAGETEISAGGGNVASARKWQPYCLSKKKIIRRRGEN